MLTRTQAEQRQSLIDTKTEDIAYTSNVSTARDVAIHERGPWMQTRKMKEAQEYEARELLDSSALVLELFPATEMQGSPHDESIDIALKNILATCDFFTCISCRFDPCWRVPLVPSALASDTSRWPFAWQLAWLGLTSSWICSFSAGSIVCLVPSCGYTSPSGCTRNSQCRCTNGAHTHEAKKAENVTDQL